MEIGRHEVSTNENEEERRADAKEGRRRQCEQGRRERGRLTCPFLRRYADVRTRCLCEGRLRGIRPAGPTLGALQNGEEKKKRGEERG